MYQWCRVSGPAYFQPQRFHAVDATLGHLRCPLVGRVRPALACPFSPADGHHSHPGRHRQAQVFPQRPLWWKRHQCHAKALAPGLCRIQTSLENHRNTSCTHRERVQPVLASIAAFCATAVLVHCSASGDVRKRHMSANVVVPPVIVHAEIAVNQHRSFFVIMRRSRKSSSDTKCNWRIAGPLSHSLPITIVDQGSWCKAGETEGVAGRFHPIVCILRLLLWTYLLPWGSCSGPRCNVQ